MERIGNKAYINITLILLNALYFLYLEIIGSSENSLFMIEKGAMYVPLILERHQYYRLFTSIFMHFGMKHLSNNMVVLFILGDNLERAIGHVKYLFFYLFCGIGANICSLIVEIRGTGYPVVSAGASGAIFGVVGGLIYVVGVNRGKLEDLSSLQLFILVAFSLYYGFTNTGIDNAAHVGGLVIGVFLGILFYRSPGKNRIKRHPGMSEDKG
ncbi:rhomboid family intramembrane serine protease [Clostridiaceae bacterium]|nr:rhomboid family intramembrane serine protease [Clostridiaceae bacterium]